MKAFEEKFPNIPESIATLIPAQEISIFYAKQLAREEGWRAFGEWVMSWETDAVTILILKGELEEK